MPEIISNESLRVMDEALRMRKSPNSFLQNLLFPASVRKAPLPVDVVQWDEIEYARIMAPFTNPYGNAFQIGGVTGGSKLIQIPDIFLKNPLTTANEYFTRMLGSSTIFLGRGSVNPMARAVEDALYEGFSTMKDMAVNTQEWMAAKVLEGKMTYVNTITGAAFELDLNKPAANTVEATIGWDNADDSLPDVLGDLEGMKITIADAETPFAITDVIMGSNVYPALMKLIRKKRIPNLETYSNISVGELSLVNQFTAEGAIYIGKLAGYRLWHYRRKDQTVGGTELIRPDYIEFISTDAQASGRQMEFGSHKGDINAVRTGTDICVDRTWVKDDQTGDRPSIIGFYETRPLLYTKLPKYMFSFKATNV